MTNNSIRKYIQINPKTCLYATSKIKKCIKQVRPTDIANKYSTEFELAPNLNRIIFRLQVPFLLLEMICFSGFPVKSQLAYLQLQTKLWTSLRFHLNHSPQVLLRIRYVLVYQCFSGKCWRSCGRSFRFSGLPVF